MRRCFLPSPLQGGGREGGPAPGCAGVPPASREARTRRMRAFGPPGRRDAGAPRRSADERDREGPRPGCGAGSPPSRPPPFQGGGAQTARMGLSGIVVVGRRDGSPPFSLLPPSGGRSGGGSAPGCAGAPPASREARTRRMRAFGPPGRRDAGAPRRSTDERDREGPRPGCGAGSPPSRPPPLPGGRREDPGGGGTVTAARAPAPTPPSFRGGRDGATRRGAAA